MAGGDYRTTTQHRDAVRDAAHLLQLVADQDDGAAFGRDLAEGAHQVLRLLGGEDRRRLVENQDGCATLEGLENLDALLLAD